MQFSCTSVLIAFADCVEHLGISSSLSHEVFHTSHLDHIFVVYHRRNDVTCLGFSRLITCAAFALSAMTVNPLIATIILDKLTLTKAKEVPNASAFPAVSFLCAVFVEVTNHLFFESKNKACLSFGCAQSGTDSQSTTGQRMPNYISILSQLHWIEEACKNTHGLSSVQ